MSLPKSESQPVGQQHATWIKMRAIGMRRNGNCLSASSFNQEPFPIVANDIDVSTIGGVAGELAHANARVYAFRKFHSGLV